MNIPIWVYDREKSSKKELTGKTGVNTRKATLYLNAEDIICFWVDDEIDDETGTKDILFYVGTISFRTQWSVKREAWFRNIIIKREIKTTRK